MFLIEIVNKATHTTKRNKCLLMSFLVYGNAQALYMWYNKLFMNEVCCYMMVVMSCTYWATVMDYLPIPNRAAGCPIHIIYAYDITHNSGGGGGGAAPPGFTVHLYIHKLFQNFTTHHQWSWLFMSVCIWE